MKQLLIILLISSLSTIVFANAQPSSVKGTQHIVVACSSGDNSSSSSDSGSSS